MREWLPARFRQGCVRRVMACILALTVLLLAMCVARADTQAYTQRRINEFAAGLEAARRAIVEDSGLYRRHETLDSYIDRISRPMGPEPETAFRARMEHYLRCLAKASSVARGLIAAPPSLIDDSVPNRMLWKHIRSNAEDLPRLVNGLRDLCARDLTRPAQDRVAVTPAFLHAMAVLSALLGGLRDARP